MRCLVLADTFPNAFDPWRGPYNRRQVECLARLCSVTVIDPLPWTRLLRDLRAWKLTLGEDRVLDGIATYHPAFWYVPVLGRGAIWKGVYSAASRALRRHAVSAADVILATFAYPHGLAARRLAAEAGVPYVVKVRGSDLHSLSSRGSRRRLTAEALRGAAGVVAVSRNLADIALELGARRERVHVLTNGLDAERFPMLPRDEARKRLGVAGTGRIILFVGNLLPVKGVDVLMAALGKDRWESPLANALTVVAGEGPMRGRVESGIARDGLKERVRLMGHLGREAVTLWMNAADVLVLPSRNEGCPNVVLEALCCGTPVVASRVGAVPDLLDEACAVIVKPGDAAELASGLNAALQKEWDRPSLRRRVHGMSWEANARTLEGILRQAVEVAGSARREAPEA